MEALRSKLDEAGWEDRVRDLARGERPTFSLEPVAQQSLVDVEEYLCACACSSLQKRREGKNRQTCKNS
jgi:hypothetical protein